MDNEILTLLWSRLDRLEEKIDILMDEKSKRDGKAIVISLIWVTIFQIVLAFLEHK